ncbi:hypothetical protein GA0115245_144030 [Streptomyces sp. di188]|nr:hypothetical protein GA0115238_105229 [Streptomyces sp. di50b]SCE49054.1 hypothetical protein GA0115245_144030 [Streptomyces sp. di188]
METDRDGDGAHGPTSAAAVPGPRSPAPDEDEPNG